MSVRKCIAVFAMILGFSLSLFAAVSYDSIYWAPPLDVVGTKIVNAKGYAVVLKGFSLMEPTQIKSRSQIEHFRNDWKITILRVPWEVAPGHGWVVGNIFMSASYFAACDSVLKWCRDNHIYVLFDGWHEGGQGNTSGDWSSTVAAWRIMADHYKNQDHILWEIYNEPHNISWNTWVPMAEQLIDTIRARNPVAKVIVAGTTNWCQQTGVPGLKFNRDKVIYSWHPYSGVYGSNNATTWEQRFGFIMTSGVAPVMNTEWGGGDPAGYETPLIQYMKDKGISWTGWCYSQSWAPTMLTSENPEVRNASGNMMYNAYHDTVPVISVGVDVKHPVAGSSSVQSISIVNSTLQFNCAEPSRVMLSLYALNGSLVKKMPDQILTKGNHSVQWDAHDDGSMSVAPGLYAVQLKIKDSEFHTLVNVAR